MRCNRWRLGEGGKISPAHDGAVVVHEPREHANQRQAGESAEIDTGFSMVRAHEHAAFLGHQRKYMAGPHEISRSHVAVGERAYGIGAVLRGDAGGEAVANVDRDGEGGAERRIVARHHRVEMQAARLVPGKRRADDARRVADDERHLLGRAQRRRDKQVALALAVVVIGHDDELAASEGGHRGQDALRGVIHFLSVFSFLISSASRGHAAAETATLAPAIRHATMASPTGTARMPTHAGGRDFRCDGRSGQSAGSTR
jgi:hypothetical protein